MADWAAVSSSTPRKGMRVRTRRSRTPATALARSSLALLAIALPVAFAGVRPASAGALAVVREHTAVPLDALHAPDLLAVRAADPTGEQARLAVDGRDDTVWTGRAGETQWKWAAAFAKPVHLGLLRARFGSSATSGVPTAFRWEVRSPEAGGAVCSALSATSDDAWSPLEDAGESAPATAGQPSRRSWFVDADACGLRLVVDRTNAGPPVLREVQAIESARDVLRVGRRERRRVLSGDVRGRRDRRDVRAALGRRARQDAVDAPRRSRRAAARRPRAPRPRLRRDERGARRRWSQLRDRVGAGSLHARGERRRATLRPGRQRAAPVRRIGPAAAATTRHAARAPPRARAAPRHDGRHGLERPARAGGRPRRPRDRGVPRGR